MYKDHYIFWIFAKICRCEIEQSYENAKKSIRENKLVYSIFFWQTIKSKFSCFIPFLHVTSVMWSVTYVTCLSCDQFTYHIVININFNKFQLSFCIGVQQFLPSWIRDGQIVFVYAVRWGYGTKTSRRQRLHQRVFGALVSVNSDI